VNWQVIVDLANRMGYPMHYTSEEDTWQEIVLLTPVFRGITYERLQHDGIPWNCRTMSTPWCSIPGACCNTGTPVP
jgi:predicted molibdopterin-dependent oxidoreductase YjgC